MRKTSLPRQLQKSVRRGAPCHRRFRRRESHQNKRLVFSSLHLHFERIPTISHRVGNNSRCEQNLFADVERIFQKYSWTKATRDTPKSAVVYHFVGQTKEGQKMRLEVLRRPNRGVVQLGWVELFSSSRSYQQEVLCWTSQNKTAGREASAKRELLRPAHRAVIVKVEKYVESKSKPLA